MPRHRQVVPDELATLLRDLRRSRSPALDEVLRRASARGWTAAALGRALGVRSQSVHYRINRIDRDRRPAIDLPTELCDLEIPSPPVRGLNWDPHGPIDEQTRARLVALHHRARRVHGRTPLSHPTRLASAQLTDELYELVRLGHTPRCLAVILDVTPGAVDLRLRRHGYDVVPPEFAHRRRERSVGQPQRVHHQRVPDAFVRELRDMHRTGDPHLGPVLREARAAGWTYSSLGLALGLTRERVRRIIMATSATSSSSVRRECSGSDRLVPAPVAVPSLDDQTIAELRELYAAARHTSGKMRPDHPARRASGRLTLRLAELAATGVSYAELGRALGVTRAAIQNRMRRHGCRETFPLPVPGEDPERVAVSA